MNKISNVIEFVKARKEAKGDEGFSLIELVVAVGILAILSVTGVVAYSQITQNARKTAVESAASEVFTAAVAYESDGIPNGTNNTPAEGVTNAGTAVKSYNDSSDGITVSVTGSGETLSITATDENGNSATKRATPVTTP